MAIDPEKHCCPADGPAVAPGAYNDWLQSVRNRNTNPVYGFNEVVAEKRALMRAEAVLGPPLTEAERAFSEKIYIPDWEKVAGIP